VSMSVIFLCVAYCTWVVYLMWYYLWRKSQDTTTNVRFTSLSPRARNTSKIDGQVQIPTATEDTKSHKVVIPPELPPNRKKTNESEIEYKNEKRTSLSATSDLDIKLKVVVTLYVGACWTYCASLFCEFMAHVMNPYLGKICLYAPYAFYSGVFTESLFYLFYAVRIHVILKNSIFQLPNGVVAGIGITSAVLLSGFFTSYLSYTQRHQCQFDLTAIVLLGITIVVHVTLNVVLFIFFMFQLRRATCNANLSSQEFQKELKIYLGRLFRLFLVAEAAALVLYGTCFIPHYFELTGPAVAIDMSVNCTIVMLSFGFAKSAFPWCKI